MTNRHGGRPVNSSAGAAIEADDADLLGVLLSPQLAPIAISSTAWRVWAASVPRKTFVLMELAFAGTRRARQSGLGLCLHEADNRTSI